MLLSASSLAFKTEHFDLFAVCPCAFCAAFDRALDDTQLGGSIPESLGNCINLTALWLNKNQLKGDFMTHAAEVALEFFFRSLF